MGSCRVFTPMRRFGDGRAAPTGSARLFFFFVVVVLLRVVLLRAPTERLPHKAKKAK